MTGAGRRFHSTKSRKSQSEQHDGRIVLLEYEPHVQLYSARWPGSIHPAELTLRIVQPIVQIIHTRPLRVIEDVECVGPEDESAPLAEWLVLK